MLKIDTYITEHQMSSNNDEVLQIHFQAYIYGITKCSFECQKD